MFVVTGGGSGIGSAVAQALAMRGKAVLIVGRREEPLAKTADLHQLIDYLCADVASVEGRKLVEQRLEQVPVLHGLIHNAGIIEPIMPLMDIQVSAWQRVMATNLEAPLFLTQMFAKKLTSGRVLNIGSGAAYFPVTGWAAYCVSKAGLSMLTRCWQMEYPGLAVASVMPGIIDTNMQALIRHAKHMDSEKLEFFRRLKQTGQLLTPETVAAFICWLLLDIDTSQYVAEEWDIYDKKHQPAWLRSPHFVPVLE